MNSHLTYVQHDTNSLYILLYSVLKGVSSPLFIHTQISSCDTSIFQNRECFASKIPDREQQDLQHDSTISCDFYTIPVRLTTRTCASRIIPRFARVMAMVYLALPVLVHIFLFPSGLNVAQILQE